MHQPAETLTIPGTDQTGNRKIGIDSSDMLKGLGLAEDDVLAFLGMAELEHGAPAVRQADTEVLVPLAFKAAPVSADAIGLACEGRENLNVEVRRTESPENGEVVFQLSGSLWPVVTPAGRVPGRSQRIMDQAAWMRVQISSRTLVASSPR